MKRPELVEVIGDYEPFLDGVWQEVAASGISFHDLAQADHVCYRTETTAEYEQKAEDLQGVARLLGEVSVAGRPISTFRLHEPLRYYHWRIDAVELPAPKQGSAYQSGLEHVEFVLFDDIPTFVAKYSHLDFDMKAAQRGINPEVGLKLGEYGVKFHLLALPHVVYLEEKLGIEAK